MKKRGMVGMIIMGWVGTAWAYPPAVGIVGKSRNCLACHIQNGPWQEETHLVLDLVDSKTQKSLKQADGTFRIEVERGEAKTIFAVLGRAKGDPAPAPTRNGWLFLDPDRIPEEFPSNKFPKGWEVNQSLGCRMVGDALSGYEGASLTVAPMTILATAQAKEVQMEWQAMLTRGESVKGKPKEGLIATYVMRLITLVVKEPDLEKSKRGVK